MTIDQSIKSRAKAKIEIDALLMQKYNLSTDSKVEPKIERATVLTEGAIMDGSHPTDVRLYLTKGVLADAVKKMEDRVYYLNLGHDTVSPLSIIGSFTKQDLTIAVEEEDGRSWLKADFTLDEEHVFVKELRRQGKPLSFSAEFYVTDQVVLELTPDELSELGYKSEHSYFLRAVKSLELDGFAVVIEPADINAYQVTQFNNNNNMAKTKLDNTQDTPIQSEEVVAEFVVHPGDNIAEVAEEVTAKLDELQEEVKVEVKEEVQEEVKEEVQEEVKEEVQVDEVENQLLSLKSRHELMAGEIENLKKENLELKNSYEKLALEKKNELEKVQKTLSELLQKAEPVTRDDIAEDVIAAKAIARTAI